MPSRPRHPVGAPGQPLVHTEGHIGSFLGPWGTPRGASLPPRRAAGFVSSRGLYQEVGGGCRVPAGCLWHGAPRLSMGCVRLPTMVSSILQGLQVWPGAGLCPHSRAFLLHPSLCLAVPCCPTLRWVWQVNTYTEEQGRADLPHPSFQRGLAPAPGAGLLLELGLVPRRLFLCWIFPTCQTWEF